tara:strand:+ start:212 stop:421 length:210 start_codon:yes stop_codon:yes gene_type:complete
MTDLNLQHDNHQDNVNKKMLKYVESISTIALSNRAQIRNLEKGIKYICYIILATLGVILLHLLHTSGVI